MCMTQAYLASHGLTEPAIIPSHVQQKVSPLTPIFLISVGPGDQR